MQHSISLSAHPVTRAPESLPPLRSLWAALSCPRGYDIRPARTPKQHGLANSLVRRMYAWRGYRTEAHRQPLEDPNHVTLAAWQYDEVVATLTLRRDSAGGLLADAHYGDVLEGLRRPDRVVAKFLAWRSIPISARASCCTDCSAPRSITVASIFRRATP